jgi:hypothetical protein
MAEALLRSELLGVRAGDLMSTRAGSWPFGSCGEPLDEPAPVSLSAEPLKAEMAHYSDPRFGAVDPVRTTNGAECASPAYLRLMRRLEAEGDAEYVAARVQIVDVDATPVSRDRRLADEAAVPLVGEIR